MSPDPFSLADKRILVTGASSGIGRQTAISCAAMGAELVISGRDPERLEQTLGQLQGTGHLQCLADLQNETDRIRLADTAARIDGVVHCAGISAIVPFRMVSEQHIDHVFGINFRGPIMLTQRLISRRHVTAGGSVVFISSSAAHIGPIATSMYAAREAALIPAARALALEVAARQQIRVNCISPGYTRTPMLDGLNTSGPSIEENYALAPLGLGEPEDVANAAIFLLSDASRWVTRTTIQVDGGLTSRISF